MDSNPSTSTSTSASTNAFTHLCGEEEEDYVLQIESASGRTRTRKAFLERVRWAATVLSDDFHLGVGAEEDEGRELVMVCIENTADFAVLVYALVFLAVPFMLVHPPNLEDALREHRPTRVFAAHIKDAVRSIHTLLAASSSSSSSSSDSNSFEVPRLYATSAYSTFCFPELWRMIALAKRRRIPQVQMRFPPSGGEEARRHARLIRYVEEGEGYVSMQREHVVQMDPVKELWTMLRSRRTYVILPQSSSKL